LQAVFTLPYKAPEEEEDQTDEFTGTRASLPSLETCLTLRLPADLPGLELYERAWTKCNAQIQVRQFFDLLQRNFLTFSLYRRRFRAFTTLLSTRSSRSCTHLAKQPTLSTQLSPLGSRFGLD
jgi:hypothetical protein